MKWACLCPLPTHQGGRLRVNSPHGAGFIDGSALHPINRIPIFLADANKKRRMCHNKTASNKIPTFQLIPIYEKAVSPEKGHRRIQVYAANGKKILLGFHAIDCNGKLSSRLFSNVIKLVPKSVVDSRETGSCRVCNIKCSGNAIFCVHLDCCLVGRSV